MLKNVSQFIQKILHKSSPGSARHQLLLPLSYSGNNNNKVRWFKTTPIFKYATTYDKLFFKLASNRTEAFKDKITVVGGNEVGMTTVFSLLTKEITSTVCLLDMTDERLEGETMDLQHGSLFLNNAMVNGSKDHAISANSRIVVVTAGTDQDKEETRADFVSRNAGIMRALIPQLVKYSPDAIFLIASEPVDIMTYVAWKSSGLTKNRIIGSGTNLDSARFRYLLAEKLDYNSVTIRIQNEHCILDEIFLSLPCVIGQSGVTGVIRQPLTESEAASLRKSAEDIVITQDALKTVAMT
ncbi:hypothetical protein K1T71_000097 [Dendrolimus kikuchii]|uniref:Uncharacterized protein n=1 Tax=Dendrolimus kikuchii TaxID=765133 RepID=A0ACC1DI81_9NEOP|nr:hypothetical protein K1T71_000097 [Dendrolimus kikuchii]